MVVRGIGRKRDWVEVGCGDETQKEKLVSRNNHTPSGQTKPAGGSSFTTTSPSLNYHQHRDKAQFDRNTSLLIDICADR